MEKDTFDLGGSKRLAQTRESRRKGEYLRTKSHQFFVFEDVFGLFVACSPPDLENHTVSRFGTFALCIALKVVLGKVSTVVYIGPGRSVAIMAVLSDVIQSSPP